MEFTDCFLRIGDIQFNVGLGKFLLEIADGSG